MGSTLDVDPEIPRVWESQLRLKYLVKLASIKISSVVSLTVWEANCADSQSLVR